MSARQTDFKVLYGSHTLIIFTYAPAGLSHLRVTDALYDGLNDHARSLILGADNTRISFMHRIASIRIFGKVLMELFQYGVIEQWYTKVYRTWLHREADDVYKQVVTLLEQHITRPKRVVFICTHFSLSHQLSCIKQRIEKEYNVKVYLFMQVTDDSPQPIWYVPSADTIFVPSEYTKEKLNAYGKREKLDPVSFTVIPYPLTPNLSQELTPVHYVNRKEQYKSNSQVPINIVFPVSGAAVGLDYYKDLIDSLYQNNTRLRFSIVSKNASFTKDFLSSMIGKSYCKIHAGEHDREVVQLHEDVYTSSVIGFEVTKPSEQAFKALFTPKQKGGSFLLFTYPVGKQEWDNLAFLMRHNLIPDNKKQTMFWNKAKRGESLDLKELHGLETIRGLRLPQDPFQASQFILWCLKEGLFLHSFVNFKKGKDSNNEFGSDGVIQFWDSVENVIIDKENK